MTRRERAIEARDYLAGELERFVENAHPDNVARGVETLMGRLDAYVDQRIAHVLAEMRKAETSADVSQQGHRPMPEGGRLEAGTVTPDVGAEHRQERDSTESGSGSGRGVAPSAMTPTAPQRDPDCGLSTDVAAEHRWGVFDMWRERWCPRSGTEGEMREHARKLRNNTLPVDSRRYEARPLPRPETAASEQKASPSNPGGTEPGQLDPKMVQGDKPGETGTSTEALKLAHDVLTHPADHMPEAKALAREVVRLHATMVPYECPHGDRGLCRKCQAVASPPPAPASEPPISWCIDVDHQVNGLVQPLSGSGGWCTACRKPFNASRALRDELIGCAAALVRIPAVDGLRKGDDRELIEREPVVEIAMRLKRASDMGVRLFASTPPAPASGGDERRWYLALYRNGDLCGAAEGESAARIKLDGYDGGSVIPVVPTSRAEAAERELAAARANIEEHASAWMAVYNAIGKVNGESLCDATVRTIRELRDGLASAERSRDELSDRLDLEKREHEETRGYRQKAEQERDEYRTTARQLDETARVFRDERDAALARVAELEEQVRRYETTQPMRAEQAAHSMRERAIEALNWEHDNADPNVRTGWVDVRDHVRSAIARCIERIRALPLSSEEEKTT